MWYRLITRVIENPGGWFIVPAASIIGFGVSYWLIVIWLRPEGPLGVFYLMFLIPALGAVEGIRRARRRH
jgi:hypothetical protein